MTDFLFREKGFYVGQTRSKPGKPVLRLAKRGDVMKFFMWDDDTIGCEVTFKRGGHMTMRRKPSAWLSLGLEAIDLDLENDVYTHGYEGVAEIDSDHNHKTKITVYVYKKRREGIRVVVEPIRRGRIGAEGHEEEDGYWDADPNPN